MASKGKTAHLPMVAIVGRPNVGKSTLFNRLAGKRIALVDDMPGVTRDRNYARMEWIGQTWALIDTGGFEPEGEDILRHMRAQTEMALGQADLIVFLLDGKEGVNPADREVADILRKQGKPVFFAVNKIDGPKHEEKAVEFWELGPDRLFTISSEHGYGVDDLLDAIVEVLPGLTDEQLEEYEEGQVRVAVVGRPNAGKSTLINTLLGEERLLVHHKPGTTRDAVDSEVILNGRKYLFVDTAGMRRKSKIDTRVERFSVMRSIQGIERCHVSLLMIDATGEIVDQDAKIAGLAHDRGRGLIILFNKWDLVEDPEAKRRELEEEVSRSLVHVDYAPILTVSAKEKKRLGKIASTLEEVVTEHNRRITTGELNRALESWLSKNPPPGGAMPIKIYYVSQTGVRPPSFVFFVNKPDKVPEHYKRYLANRIRDTFGFRGTPVKMFFRPRGKK